jgi:hypothetical protein
MKHVARDQMHELEARMEQALGAGRWDAPHVAAAAAAAPAAAAPAGIVTDLGSLDHVRAAAAPEPAPLRPAAEPRRSLYRYVVLGVGNFGFPIKTFGPSIMILDAARTEESARASSERITAYLLQTFGICPAIVVAPMRVPLLIPYSTTREHTHRAVLEHKERVLVQMYRDELQRSKEFHAARRAAAAAGRTDVLEQAQQFHSLMLPEYILQSKREEAYKQRADLKGVSTDAIKAEQFERVMHSMGKKTGHTMQIKLPADKGLAIVRVWRDFTGDKTSKTWRAPQSSEGNEPLISIEDIIPETMPQKSVEDMLDALRAYMNDDGVPLDVVETGVFIALYDMNESTQRMSSSFVENSGVRRKDEIMQAHRESVQNAERVKQTEGETYRSLPKRPTPGAVQADPATVQDGIIPGALPDAPYIAPATEDYAATHAFPRHAMESAIPESPARRGAAAAAASTFRRA